MLKTSSPFEHISRIENPKTKLLTEIGTFVQSIGLSLAAWGILTLAVTKNPYDYKIALGAGMYTIGKILALKGEIEMQQIAKKDQDLAEETSLQKRVRAKEKWDPILKQIFGDDWPPQFSWGETHSTQTDQIFNELLEKKGHFGSLKITYPSFDSTPSFVHLSISEQDQMLIVIQNSFVRKTYEEIQIPEASLKTAYEIHLLNYPSHLFDINRQSRQQELISMLEIAKSAVKNLYQGTAIYAEVAPEETEKQQALEKAGFLKKGEIKKERKPKDKQTVTETRFVYVYQPQDTATAQD